MDTAPYIQKDLHLILLSSRFSASVIPLTSMERLLIDMIPGENPGTSYAAVSRVGRGSCLEHDTAAEHGDCWKIWRRENFREGEWYIIYSGKSLGQNRPSSAKIQCLSFHYHLGVQAPKIHPTGCPQSHLTSAFLSRAVSSRDLSSLQS